MFVRKFWKNRFVEHPGRRRLKDVSTGRETVVDVSRDEGEIYQTGDAFSAAAMDDLEGRIADKSSNVAFLENGNIEETYEDGSKLLTEFLEDGNIKETNYLEDGAIAGIKTTRFLEDGNIEVIVEYKK